MALLYRFSWEARLLLFSVLCSIYLTAQCMPYEEVMRICHSERSGNRFLPSLKCNSYFMCFAGQPILRNCPPGTQYDTKLGGCNTMGYSCRNQVLYGNHIVETRHSVRNNGVHGLSNRDSGEHIIQDAMTKVRSLIKSEAQVARTMHGVVDSGPYRYVSAFLYAKPVAKHMSHSAHVLLEAHKLMRRRRGINRRYLKVLRPSTKIGIPDAKQNVSQEIDECPYPKTIICDRSSRFRTIDGCCNNLQRPILGRSNVPHRRLVRANYADGIEEARVSTLGGELPHARDVSRHLFADMDRPSGVHTLILMTWGQFIDHDLTRTAITMCPKDEKGFGETEEVKCGMDGCQTEGEGLEACWPIPVSVDDEDFGRTNRCIKFVRSEATPPLDCRSAHREQLNQVTTWLDGSNIYGSTGEEGDSVRALSNKRRGQLKMRPHPKGRHFKSMLPSFDDELCRNTNSTIRCFLAGDERVNENSALTTMHTVWVREHNRIEEQLHHLNPHWSGERLYQESRRIVIAMMQNVVINEQLPIVLGQDLAASYDLTPAENWYYGYSPRFDPRVSQAFATAAYRFGHTLIQEQFTRVHGHGRRKGEDLMLSDSFFRPVHVYDIKQGGIDALLRGLTSQGAQTYDNFFTKQVSKSLFTERPPNGPGMDLLALNIQRGRDHGLPSYNEYRQFCGLGRVSSFSDLNRDINDNHTRAIIQQLYRHPDDIDLFAGGICERPMPGGLIGPTFGCIIGDQFRSIRKGDRFWYENRNRVLGFTKAQLKEIRKMRLSKVICENGDNVDLIQPFVMLRPLSEVNQKDLNSATRQRFYSRHGNKLMKCSSLPDLDLRKWKEY